MKSLPALKRKPEDYIQSVATLPSRAVAGFTNPPSTDDPFQQLLNKVPGRKNIAGAMSGIFGQDAVEHPIIAIGADTQPMKMADRQFGLALRDAVPSWAENNILKPKSVEDYLPNPANPRNLISTRKPLNEPVQPLEIESVPGNPRKFVPKR